MLILKLNNYNEITNFLDLLELHKNPNLKKINDSIIELRLQKENAVGKCNYKKAAQLYEKEKNMIRKIIKLLNKKGILENNILQVSVGGLK